MALQIGSDGMVVHARIRQARSAGIERGRIGSIEGIVVHQTDANTSAATFNSYKRKGANGAHFLIDVDGTIYQTASLQSRTNHVGHLKARCLTVFSCQKAAYVGKEGEATHRIEILKSLPARYPSNMEAIGIEMVGRAELPAGFVPPPGRKDRVWTKEQLRAEYGVFSTPSSAQNASLKWLVDELSQSLQIKSSEVFRHPVVSWKNRTEAQGARW